MSYRPRPLWFALLLRTSSRARGAIALSTFLGVATRACVLATSFLIARNDLQNATLIGVVSAGVYAIQRAACAWGRVIVESDLHKQTAGRLLESDLFEIPPADLTRITSDGTFYATQLLTQILPALVGDIIACALAFPFVVGAVVPRLLWITIGAVVIVLIGSWLVQRKTRDLEARTRQSYLALADSLAIVLEGRVEVVAQGGEHQFRMMLDERLATFRSNAIHAAYGSALLGRIPIAVAALVAVALLVDFSSRTVAAPMFAEALIVATILRLILGSLLGIHGTTRAAVFAKPYEAILNARARDDVSGAGDVLPTLPNSIEARSVSFGYGSGPPVLRDLSFTWSAKRPLFVLGSNGSGKTTLARVLLGLSRPTRGSWLLGGTDSNVIDFPRLRARTAYLPQRPYLGESHTLVMDAVKMHSGNRHLSDIGIGEALVRLGLGNAPSDFLATRIGELSAGQRQRLALARVLLREDAKLVILDEPDANLDRRGIELVTALVQDLAQTRMVIVIAHTPELLGTDADRLELPSAH